MSELIFTVYGRPEPQGSTRAFVIPGTNRASITSDNTKLKPFRSEVARMALASLPCAAPMFGKGVAVQVSVAFHFRKPESAKKRSWPVVKPDIDKLLRAILDSLTGVVFHDDAQVVSLSGFKHYGDVECAMVTVREI